MEYIVIGLLVVVIGLLWFKEPTKMKNAVTDSVLNGIRNNHQAIVDGIYDKLPEDTKGQVSEKVLKSGVSQTLDLALEVIEEGLK